MKEQFARELKELRENGLKTNPLRLEYEQKVRELTFLGEMLLAEGLSAEETAKRLHSRRRELGVIYKDSAPPLFREYIWYATAKKYGDPLGPDYAALRSRKTPEQIIESACRPIEDLNDRLSLDGFVQWFHETYEDECLYNKKTQE